MRREKGDNGLFTDTSMDDKPNIKIYDGSPFEWFLPSPIGKGALIEKLLKGIFAIKRNVMNSFQLLLNEFDEVLRKYNSVNYERLYLPLAESELEDLLKKINIRNEDFQSLYKWKNGFEFKSDINQIRCDIFFTGTLLSLDLVQNDILFNLNEGTWRNTLIPFIGNEEREWLLFENKKSINYGKIFFYSPSITIASQKPISCYDSIGNLIETTIEAYRSGIFEYDRNEDWLHKKIDKYCALARKKNPDSRFWKEENQ